MINIFEEFTKQIEKATPMRIGDTVYTISSHDFTIREVVVQQLGFSIQENKILVNGFLQEVFLTFEDAVDESKKQEIESLKQTTENYRERIAKMSEELEQDLLRLNELLSK